MGMVMKDVGDMPWDERSFLWHGHTFDFPNIRRFAAMLFINPIYIEGIEELIKQCPAPKLMHIFSGILKFLPYSASPDFVRMS
ncbi:hypothetical protein [Ruminococcus flavefaciens]|uniref:Uncharacterized protein n=1 Tax=Ruminococcus flavefaciens TaxID=1265 RepID=A0A315XXQ7_RUMFL|nr:hypothetical protein [Ruminococcus flavefaciens]PWJ10380.1 hypothetical protein IE37_03018 [Ruminococcus flavefaciens]SSA51832.1 hypothetical protein SAMN02910325_03018 [Ruminococcus flavefaciens]